MSNHENPEIKPATDKQIRGLQLIIVLVTVAGVVVVIGGLFNLTWLVPLVVAVFYIFQGIDIFLERPEARKEPKPEREGEERRDPSLADLGISLPGGMRGDMLGKIN